MTACREFAAVLALKPGERLDADFRQSLEAHLSGCADCRAMEQAYGALGSALAQTATRYAAPPALQARIGRALAVVSGPPVLPPVTTPVSRGLWLGAVGGWLSAGALASVLALSVIVGHPAWEPGARSPAVILARADDALIDNHVRALVTNHLVDVASSDRHTVKPWFRGRLDYAPPVVDLKEQGYALLGGRLDYVDRQAVAVLVYQRRQHVVDVYIRPDDTVAGPGAEPAAARPDGVLGYRRATGHSAGMTFTAVADLDAAELADFVRILGANLSPTPGLKQ